MPDPSLEQMRAELTRQIAIDFATICYFLAQKAARRSVPMPLTMSSLHPPLTASDNVRIAAKTTSLESDLFEQQRISFFRKYGLSSPATVSIRPMPELTPHDKERIRLAVEWYNVMDVYPANAIAARRYIIHTKGLAGLAHVWFVGGATGPTLFDLFECGSPAGLPSGAPPIYHDRQRMYPKMETPF